ncbi:MAG: hypothetical protein LBB20_01805 [Puniceicoccales bacterium]|jgi:hypothetical protein|nr:hypothetical protein [Puniceicoccales bacterium]
MAEDFNKKPVKKQKSDLEENFEMDFGLTGITKGSDFNKRMRLPATSSFDPSEGKIEVKLSKVLSVKTLDGVLIQLLRPDVTNRSILTPTQFRSKINELRTVFKQKKESTGKNITAPELYDDIEHLLTEEEEKCELLDHYRHMLLMG